jgi:hypothetical protein
MHIHMEGFDQYQKLPRGPRHDSESKTVIHFDHYTVLQILH